MPNQLLAIDDTALHLSVICKIAELLQFQTSGARSIDEAAALLRDFSFDCITLDLSLGERSGVEILLLLAELQCRTPVIVISGSEPETCQEIVEFGNVLGVNLYPPVRKPINFVRLRESLRQIACNGSARKFPSSFESQCR